MKKRNLEEEITNLAVIIRNNEQIPSKLQNIIIKQIEVIRKCAKPRRSNKGRNQNQNSGLLKKGIISEEMARFANWGREEAHSRVDMTIVICDYIRANDLQNHENRRIILPDKTLRDILRWNASEEEMSVSMIDASKNIFSIVKEPVAEMKEAKYYNNSELRTSDGEYIAKITKVVNNCGNLILTFDEKDGEVNPCLDTTYIIHVPLTYPKLQTKIGIHLIKPEPTNEEVVKKEKKKEAGKLKDKSKPKK